MDYSRLLLVLLVFPLLLLLCLPRNDQLVQLRCVRCPPAPRHFSAVYLNPDAEPNCHHQPRPKGF